MKIETKQSGNSLILKLHGELDESNAMQVRQHSDHLIENYSMSNFIYDFKNLSFMDSTGIGVILGRYKKLKSNKVPMCIANANRQVMKVITTTGIDKIIKII